MATTNPAYRATGLETLKDKYQAKRSVLARMNTRLAVGSAATTQAEVDSLFQDMVDMIPVGSRVSASWYQSAGDDELTTTIGVVQFSAKINDDEPSFELMNDDEFCIMLPGSLLTVLD